MAASGTGSFGHFPPWDNQGAEGKGSSRSFRPFALIKKPGTTVSKENLMNPTTGENEQPIRFAGSVLGPQRHVCAFFHSPDEEYRVLLPFIKEGFERGEKAFHIVDPTLREEHLRRLASAGINVEAAEKSGQFELRNWADAYLRDGHFDQDRMLALIQEVLDG